MTPLTKYLSEVNELIEEASSPMSMVLSVRHAYEKQRELLNHVPTLRAMLEKAIEQRDRMCKNESWAREEFDAQLTALIPKGQGDEA